MARENQKFKITRKEFEQMKEIDVRTVDRNTLVDIRDVVIRKELPREDRMIDYVRQVKNPYCYLDHGVVVKLSFKGTRSLEDCLVSCVDMES